MASDEIPGDGADENQTVMHSPSFDELLAMREGEEAVAALDPVAPIEGESTQIAPSGSYMIGEEVNDLSDAQRQQVAMAQTAMGPSFDERLAAQEAAHQAPPGFAPPAAPMAPPAAPPGFAPPAAPPPAGNVPAPFAAIPSPAPVAPSAPAAPTPAPMDVAPPKDPNIAKTMALSAADMASLGGLPGSGPVPAGFGAPQSAPGAAPGPFAPPGAAPHAPPGSAPGASGLQHPPGAHPPGAHPPGAHPPGAHPPGAQPPKQGLDAVKMFAIALGVTFLVGSCMGTALLFFLLR